MTARDAPDSLKESRLFQGATDLIQMVSSQAITQDRDIKVPDALATAQIYATLALAEQTARLADKLELLRTDEHGTLIVSPLS